MTASDFHDIAAGNDVSKAERLFRASVSAFCTLTRPSRREVIQLEDLTLPLYGRVSVEARRYVAAALSECRIAPARLVERLADDRVDIAAPLLTRSVLLTDVDLIALIGKHGLQHARAIARRPGLNPTIAQLIRALEAAAPRSSGAAVEAAPPALKEALPKRAKRKAVAKRNPVATAKAHTSLSATGLQPDNLSLRDPIRETSQVTAPPAIAVVARPIIPSIPPTQSETATPARLHAPLPPIETYERQPQRGLAEEAARARLRAMMDSGPKDATTMRKAENRTFAKLRDTAFTGNAALFRAALGEALGLTPASVRNVTDTQSYSPLLAALRSLYLGDEQIFMIAAAVFPGQFVHPEAIRLFAERCQALSQDVAAERVRTWKLEALANQIQWEDARRKRA